MIHAILFAIVLGIACGIGHLKSSYQKSEVTNVVMQWRFATGLAIEPVTHAGVYTFYEDVPGADYYKKLPDMVEKRVFIGDCPIPPSISHSLSHLKIVCILQRDDGHGMVRTMPRSQYRKKYHQPYNDRRERSGEDDIERVATIVWVVIAIVIFACFGGFVWLMIHLKKRNQRVRYQGQPQQFQVYQQPMPIYTNPQPMMEEKY